MSEQKVNELFSQVHNDQAIEDDIANEAERLLLSADDTCVEAENPYCSVEVNDRWCIGEADHAGAHTPAPLNQAEMIEYMFDRFQQLEQLIEQAGPLLEQAGPLLASFGGQANSPLGRIAGSLFR